MEKSNLINVIKKMYKVQSGTLNVFKSVYPFHTALHEYNSFTTLYKRNFLMYYLHLSSDKKKLIDKYIFNIKKHNQERFIL